MGESLLILWILLELNAPAWTYLAWVFLCGERLIAFIKYLKDLNDGDSLW